MRGKQDERLATCWLSRSDQRNDFWLAVGSLSSSSFIGPWFIEREVLSRPTKGVCGEEGTEGSAGEERTTWGDKRSLQIPIQGVTLHRLRSIARRAISVTDRHIVVALTDIVLIDKVIDEW